jgi:3-phenylpropionate/trans-cinnamate dioxygenase ferredoxin reductase subunit
MEDRARYVLVGGGLAAVWAAQNIRERDKEGRILIVSRELRPPYDKPPLSKQYLSKAEVPEDDAYSKFDNWYPDNNVELRLGEAATKLHPAGKTVHLANGDVLHYEKLLLCTGASPRRLEVPGVGLEAIYTLRTIEDSLAIRKAMHRSKSAALVGAGYLNVEVASGALEHGLHVTVIEQSDRPWPRFASPALGGFVRGYYEQRGVQFLLNEEVEAFTGTGGVTGVATKSGKRVECDMAVVSVGATLNSRLAADAGLSMGDRGGVLVNEYLETSAPDVYAAGDIACFQDLAMGKQWHAEHHQNAKWHGRAVGAIMAGERKPYNQVPYFYSDFLDLHMVQRGDPAFGGNRDTRILGDLAGGEFTELYSDDSGRLRMGVAISHTEKNLDPIADKLEELIRTSANAADLTPQAVGMP